MTTTYIVLLALALLIIASLGAYALHLLRRVKQTEALQKEEEGTQSLPTAFLADFTSITTAPFAVQQFQSTTRRSHSVLTIQKHSRD